MTPSAHTALVLSGGGVRGAYEVGVVRGLLDVLGPRPTPPFSVFAGTSVGAINAAYLASHADQPDLGVPALMSLWTGLHLDVHLRSGRRGHEHGWSLLDPRPLEQLVEAAVAWPTLREQVARGRVRALIVAALDLGSARTTMFAELSPGVQFEPSRDPARQARRGPLARDHLLASAAIPLVFPTRTIDGRHYCDGGLRFNTPLAPAIRAGARKLVVVSLAPTTPAEATASTTALPAPHLLGKLFSALVMDPLGRDLQVLDRFNRLLGVLEQCLDPSEMARVEAVLQESRGAPYQRLQTLVFQPSEDLGRLAAHHLRQRPPTTPGLPGWLVRQLLRRWPGQEAAWASYVLFDGTFAAELIELGRRDARARADEIQAFFCEDSAAPQGRPREASAPGR